MLIGSIFHEIMARLSMNGLPSAKEYRENDTSLLTTSLTHILQEKKNILEEYDIPREEVTRILTPWISWAVGRVRYHAQNATRILTEYEASNPRFNVRGRIDLIILTPQETRIIEWKTGRLREGFMTAHTLQADIYLLLTEDMPHRKVILSSVSTRQEAVWQPSDFTRVRIEKLIRRLHPILTGEEEPEAVRSTRCKHCPYVSRCWGRQPVS